MSDTPLTDSVQASFRTGRWNLTEAGGLLEIIEKLERQLGAANARVKELELDSRTAMDRSHDDLAKEALRLQSQGEARAKAFEEAAGMCYDTADQGHLRIKANRIRKGLE